MIVLSHFQAKKLILARKQLPQIELSLDLGLSEVQVDLGEKVIFTEQESLDWQTIEEIVKKDNTCFFVEGGDAVPIQTFSEEFDRVYTLYPTESAPTMLISGIPMHRIKDTNPWTDTTSKIEAFGFIGENILDTTTGLGYTAIQAAEFAKQVTTIELDPATREIAKKNPWSIPLFSNPKINQLYGDSVDVIRDFADNEFNGIIHDPPMFNLAGELYSLDYYRQTHRVLKQKGRMFHYIGNPDSKTGERVTRGVVDRLKSAGYSRVINKPNTFGILAVK